MSDRSLGVEYFIKAVSTGEQSALRRLEPFLADDVVYDPNFQSGASSIDHEVFSGRSAVMQRISGQWPETYGYSRMGWSEPVPDGDTMRVFTSGAVSVAFEFDGGDRIRRVALGSGGEGPKAPTGDVEEIPLAVKGVIHYARSNNTPMVVSYVDEDGAPHLSYRGSACVIGPTAISLWVREANAGLVPAIKKNPRVSLFYGELPLSMVTISGVARIATDDETRRRAYELPIESEQNHDTQRNGVAVVVDVTSMLAFVDRVRYAITR